MTRGTLPDSGPKRAEWSTMRVTRRKGCWASSAEPTHRRRPTQAPPPVWAGVCDLLRNAERPAPTRNTHDRSDEVRVGVQSDKDSGEPKS